MARKIASIALSVNAIQPTKVIDALSTAAKRLGEDLVRELDNLEKLEKEFGKNNAQYKAQKANVENLEKTIKSFNSATSVEIEQVKHLSEVIADLSGTKLRNLKTAMGEGQRLLAGLTGSPEDVARAKQIREEMKLVGDEIRKRTGEYVNMSQTVRNLGTVSDNTLAKAIKQQKELVADLNATDAAYKREMATLRQLESEEAKRANRAKSARTANVAVANQQAANDMLGRVRNGGLAGMSQQDIEAGKRAMQDYMQTLTMGSAGWKTYAEAVAKAEDHIKSFTEQQRMSVAQASQVAQTGLLNGQAVSSNQIREAQGVLNAHKGTLTNRADVAAVDAEIEQLQKRFNELNNVAERTTKVTGDAARNVREVFRNPYAASPENAQKAIESLSARLRQLPADSKGAQVLKKRIEELKGAINGTRLSQEQFDRVMANPRKASVEDLKKAYAMLQQQMQRTARDGSGAYQRMEADARKLKAEIDSTTISVQKQDSWFRNAIRNIGAYMGVFAAFNLIKQKITEVITLNMKFSDQLVDIRKVSNMAIQDVNTLARQLAKIDTRSSVQELNKLAYAGAKLGMGKYGVAGLEGFVNAANQVNVALKEDLGDDALVSLSKMTEVMGLIPKYGVEKSMLATGSAMFKLSSTSTSTAADIVEFSKRLTGMARTAGITTDQLLALGSASSSMMLMPEVSSTAFNKVFTAIQRNPKAIENSLGIEKGTIATMLEAGDAMQAIVLILEKMKEKGNMSALSGVFKDLGSDSGARLTNVMVTMAKNVDMLKEHLKTSKTAFEEASAVTKEYNMQQETAAGIMERANNMWMKAFINPEGVDNIKEFSKQWYNLSKQLTESSTWMFALKANINGLIFVMKAILVVLPQLVFWMGVGGLVGAVSSAVSVIKTLGGVMTALHYGVLVLQKALAGLSIVGRMTWIGAAIGVLAGLISYFVSVRKEANRFADAMGSLNEAYKKTRGEIFAQQQALKEYEKAINKAKKGTQERAALIKGFNDAYGQYLSKLITEKSTMQDLASAITEVNKQLEQKGMLEAKQEWKKKNVTTRYERAGEQLESFSDAVGGTVQNRTAHMTWLREFVSNTMDKDIREVEKVIKERYAYEKWDNKGTEEERLAMKERNKQVLPRRELAIEYARQLRSANYYNKKADQIFGEDPKLIIDKEGTGPIVDATDDKAATDARNNIEEFLAKIRNFYTRQMTAEMERLTAEGVEKPLQDRVVQDIQARLNTALASAKQSIVLARNTWNEFRKTMETDIKEKADENGYSQSKILYDEIQKENVAVLRSNLLAMKKKQKTDEPDVAYLYRMWFSASRDEKKNASLEQRQAEQRRKEGLEHNYTGVVQQKSFEGLFQTGLISPDMSDAASFAKDKQRIIDMLEEARKEITDVLATGSGNKQGIMSLLFGKNYAEDLQGTVFEPVLEAWDSDWQLFYDKLIQYSDEYTEAEKKAADERKKVYDFLWKKSADYFSMNERIDSTQATADANKILPNKGRSWTQANGFADITDDPEIKLMELKMKLAQNYLEFMRAHGATEEQLAEQWRNAADAANEYSQRIMESISERMEIMEQWTDPIVTFGGAMGEAFAKMGEDAEEGAQAVKDALSDMLRSWGEITIRIIAERMAQSMQQSFYNQMEEDNEQSHQEKMSDIRSSGGKKGRNTAISVAKSILNAKMQWNKKEQKQDDQSQKAITDSRADAADAMVGIERQAGSAMLSAAIQTGSTLLATKKAQDQAEIQENAGKTEANVTMSLADALGKCFAQLGPVGGAIAAAGVEALLMGLLNWALSKAFSSKSTSASSAPKVNTKLVSGMLTYDQGNLKQMYLGNDGKLYAAKSEEQLPTGIVTQPVATTINGQPSLVGERGPELVVGRETTAAMMQNAPQLLQALLDYDKNHRLGALPAYDRGNVASVVTDAPVTTASPQSGISEELLTQLLYYLQHPVAPNINMYGREGLHAKMQQADRFMKGK